MSHSYFSLCFKDHFSSLRGGNNKLDNLQNQVDEVKDIMCQNIDRVLSRGEKLDVSLEKTQDLEASVSIFSSKLIQVGHIFGLFVCLFL